MRTLAEKHKVGFFDASADEGDILFLTIMEKMYQLTDQAIYLLLNK